MKHWFFALSRALGLFSCLSAGPLHADAVPSQNPPGILEEAGALLGEMKELGQEYLDSRYKRGMTPEKLEGLANKTARKLARHRDGLAELLPRLNPATEFAAKLSQFLTKWPDETSFRRELLGEHGQGGDTVQTEVVSLWLQAPDNRVKWKPLFPLFRP